MLFRHLLAILSILIAALLAFLPVLGNGFVSWDDPWTLQRNERLAAPGVVGWAFTTTEMGHYQPLAWLAWSQTKALFGLDPTAFHALSLLGHLLNGALVYLVCVRLATIADLDGSRVRVAASVAAFAFAVHPIRVEAVAWASAFPYVLSLTLLLTALLAYLAYCRSDGALGLGWLWLSVGSYALSQLSRASAIAFPLVLLLIDAYPLRRLSDAARAGPRGSVGRRGLSWNRALLEKSPFFIVALGAAIAESAARDLATLQEVGLGARLALAAPAPFVYLGRSLLPLGLSPLDPLAIEPRLAWIPLLLGLAGLVAVTLFVWKARVKRPSLGVAWAAYVLLLAPAMGLTPSGQQATADRYVYVPGVVVSLLIGVVVASVGSPAPARHSRSREHTQPEGRPFDPSVAAVRRRRAPTVAVMGLGLGAAAALGVTTWRQTTWWHDSVALWTRAAELDPRNDIATYNLAIALAEAGHEQEAIARYEHTLRLVPDHAFARHNLNLIRAAQAEQEGDVLAQAGDLDAAIDRYDRALAADATRLHARAARGMALLQRRRFAEAATDLRVAFDTAVRLTPHRTAADKQARDDLAVANALAFALGQTQDHAAATAVLRQALSRHPEDHELAHNLARLLATTPDPTVRDGRTALRLALAVHDRTGGQDPRVLDTLAAAYAATGQFDLARTTADRAVARARQLGDHEMARDIVANATRYVTR